MEQVRINEVNVDNVIPFDKTKTGLSIRKEQLINKTLLQLEEYLTRINKFSLGELRDGERKHQERKNGIREEDGSGVFDRFYIGDEDTKKTFFWESDNKTKIPFILDCRFHTPEPNRYSSNGPPIRLETLIDTSQVHLCSSFHKKNISTKFDRRKTSISMSKQIFSSFGTETEMEEFFQRCIFHKENNETKKVKVKEYPIKEIVSFEMDDNGICSLYYNHSHPSFPKQTKDDYKEFLKQTNKYCEENDFLLGSGSGKMIFVSWDRRDLREVEWEDRGKRWMKGGYVEQNKLPSILFPRIILKGDFPRMYQSRCIEMIDDRFFPVPYYGNSSYKKYVVDNNLIEKSQMFECLSPFPVDENWYEDTSVDEDKVYQVKVITRPEVSDDFIISVPKGVEINRNILVKSGVLCITKNVDISFTEVDKELWNEEKHPSLHNDGKIIFDDDDYCE